MKKIMSGFFAVVLAFTTVGWGSVYEQGAVQGNGVQW